MSKQDEIMDWLLSPAVTLYTNAERKERDSDAPPRSDEELMALLEKLARKAARSYDPMESFGPRRYPTPKWARGESC